MVKLEEKQEKRVESKIGEHPRERQENKKEISHKQSIL